MAKPSYLAQPIVTRLPVILDEISQGLLLIPRFQRPFVWKDEQRLRVVDSIEKGMPIGSLLVWRTTSNRLKTYKRLGPYALPEVAERELHTYVLDGHQRLSTLYGALKNEEPTSEAEDEARRWPIYFDLERQEFRLASRASHIAITWLPLSRLFDPVELYDFQKRLIKNGQEKLARRAETIANKFKDYQLPIIPIVTEDLAQATESFQRVNSQGTKMSEVHMVNALMWSKNFDLNERLAEIADRLGESGWGQIESDVLLDTIKLSRDLDIYTATPREVIAVLREDPALLEQLPKYIECVIEFLAERCRVNGPAILPYKYQLAILADAARLKDGKFNKQLGDKLEEWFWLTTYTEYFSGMTSTQLRNAARHVRALVNEDVPPRPPDLPKEVLPIRRFDFNSVRSRALVLLLLNQNPHSPVAGTNMAEIIGELGVDAIPKIFSQHDLGPNSSSGPENRWIVPPKQRRRLIRILADPNQKVEVSILKSHVISAKSRTALIKGDLAGFLSYRAKQLIALERDFVVSLGLEYKE